jgi:hypothetical protein
MSGVRGQKPAGNDPGFSDRPAPADAAAWAMASGACGLTRDQRSEVKDPLGRPEGRLAQHVVKLWGMGGRDQRTESREQKRRF